MAAIALALFVTLAFTHTRVAQYFSPTLIDFTRLGREYYLNGGISFTVLAKDYDVWSLRNLKTM